MGQYFDNDPNLKSEKFNIKYYVNNQELLFKSDRGVFSKRTVDFGTKNDVGIPVKTAAFRSRCRPWLWLRNNRYYAVFI
jgi:hypothetical protein